jgi:hypothetical protein
MDLAFPTLLGSLLCLAAHCYTRSFCNYIITQHRNVALIMGRYVSHKATKSTKKNALWPLCLCGKIFQG